MLKQLVAIDVEQCGLDVVALVFGEEVIATLDEAKFEVVRCLEAGFVFSSECPWIEHRPSLINLALRDPAALQRRILMTAPAIAFGFP